MKTTWLLAAVSLGFSWAGSLPAEVRTWTSAADPTKTFEAEFKSVEGDLVTLVTPAGKSMQVKLEILSAGDNEFVKAQATAGAPDPAAPKDPAAPAPTDPAAPVAPDKPAAPVAPLTSDELKELEKAPLPKALKREVIVYERNATRRPTSLQPAKYYLIYHGGSYSGPCFKAAPEIGTKYTNLIATNPKVEMIYVGHDEKEEQLEEMLVEFGVPIPALKFGALEDVELINKHFPERGAVPLYQLLDANGELIESGEGIFEKLSALE